MREAKAWTYGIALGAGMMFLLDPRRGGARRALIRDKSMRAVHEVEDAAAIGARDLSHRAGGMIARLRHPERRDVPDHVLVERVRSTLGRHCSHPHAIHVTAKGDGCIELKGPILASDVDDVLEAVSHVPGVDAIDDDLEVHDQPGEVPALQGEPVRRTRIVRIPPAAKLVVGAAAATVAAGSLLAGRPLGLLLGGASVLAIARSMNQRSSLLLPRRSRGAQEQQLREQEPAQQELRGTSGMSVP